MRRKSIIIIVIFSISLVTAFLINSIYISLQQRNTFKESISRVHSLVLFDLDSIQFDLKKLSSKKGLILIFFDSTCEYCQLEMVQIAERINEFNDFEVIFISEQEIAVLKEVALNSDLHNLFNVRLLNDPLGRVANQYQITSFPTNIIYDKKGDMVFFSKGFVTIDKIIKIINEGKK